jgi:[acyl-carrier-protein] S-malonyltransferase
MEGDASELNRTEITQPAMLTTAYICWRVWVEKAGKMPLYMAGHSLGEYTALVCAGALKFEDALSLVRRRGQLMQAAVSDGEGAMAAILGLEDEQVISACKQASQGEVVEAVNFNSPGQVVIAGQKPAVQRAIDLLKETGAKRALMLPVSVPSHCQLMTGAAAKLSEHLQSVEIQRPQIPVIHNVDVATHDEPENIREVLVKQLYNPVRWVETIQLLLKKDVKTVIECGPGKVLAGLNKRISKDMTAFPVFDPDSLQAALEATVNNDQ